MPAWNPTSAYDWARFLGLVTTPMFARAVAVRQPGTNFVLLDGASGSMTFSVADPRELLSSFLVLEWAWSANVVNSIIADVNKNRLLILRWDERENIREIPLPDQTEAADLLSEFHERQPPTAQSSIDRAIDIFRAVRREVNEFGGSELDAVQAFNLVLKWAEVLRRGDAEHGRGMSHILSTLSHLGLQTSRYSFSRAAHSMPIGDLAEDLLSSSSGYRLDPSLLLRHSSGNLFQEAHIDLGTNPNTQRKLFAIMRPGLPRPRGRLKPDAHYTPGTLARYLADVAVAEFLRINPGKKNVTVLDPACGSGVFLIEATRALSGQVDAIKLHGIDESDLSRAMAESAVVAATDETRERNASLQIRVEKGNSLACQWESPQIILMNPPFLPWRSTKAEIRSTVKTTLKEFYSGHSDTAIAFLAKAISELRIGSVLASVVPASILQSKSASKLRSSIIESSDLNLCAVGRFRGYGYFPQATVEPGFIVLSRVASAADRGPFVELLAESEVADLAIQAARIDASSRRGDGWEVRRYEALEHHTDDWTPRPSVADDVLAKIRSTPSNLSVTSLFSVFLGIRTGWNPAFEVSTEEYHTLGEAERCFFLPLADDIRRGRIRRGKYVFYPYDRSGELLLATEEEVESRVPTYYHTKLRPLRHKLINRKSLRNRRWWELSEPRTTWLAMRPAKFVTKTFGRRGSFAYDREGAFAVVQGHAWVLPKDMNNESQPWAYLAILNSPAFEALLDYFCPRQQGGQYELADRFLDRVPVPDLRKVGRKIVQRLCRFGQGISRGDHTPLRQLDDVVAAAYGVDSRELRAGFPLTASSRLECDFQELASRWKHDTGSMSSPEQMAMHPAYQQKAKHNAQQRRMPQSGQVVQGQTRSRHDG